MGTPYATANPVMMSIIAVSLLASVNEFESGRKYGFADGDITAGTSRKIGALTSLNGARSFSR
jgi:hypothetical protein